MELAEAVYLQVTSQLLKLSLTRLSGARREPAVGLSGCPTMLRSWLQDRRHGPGRGSGSPVASERDLKMIKMLFVTAGK